MTDPTPCLSARQHNALELFLETVDDAMMASIDGGQVSGGDGNDSITVGGGSDFVFGEGGEDASVDRVEVGCRTSSRPGHGRLATGRSALCRWSHEPIVH